VFFDDILEPCMVRGALESLKTALSTNESGAI